MKQPKINWARERAPDKYQEHEAFLWGAFSHYFPGICRPPLHPKLFEEFLLGSELAHKGMIRVTAREPDPKEIVRRLKQEHELKRAERAAVGPPEQEFSARCKHTRQTSIMGMQRCMRAATKDGYCTQHHLSYESPTQRAALAALSSGATP